MKSHFGGTLMAWVSFDEIKHAVSLEMVINHYRIELRRVNARYAAREMPSARCTALTRAAQASRQRSQKAWAASGRANRTHASPHAPERGGNALDFVATMERCSIRDAAVKLQEWFGTSIGNSRRTAASRRNQNRPHWFQKKNR